MMITDPTRIVSMYTCPRKHNIVYETRAVLSLPKTFSNLQSLFQLFYEYGQIG